MSENPKLLGLTNVSQNITVGSRSNSGCKYAVIILKETISIKYDILSVVGDRIPIYFINNMGKDYPYAATTNTETFTK